MEKQSIVSTASKNLYNGNKLAYSKFTLVNWVSLPAFSTAYLRDIHKMFCKLPTSLKISKLCAETVFPQDFKAHVRSQ